MRRLQHMANAGRNVDMMELMSRFGHTGYAVYWLTLEAIAERTDDVIKLPCLSLSPKNWRRVTSVSPQKFLKIINFLSSRKIFSVEISNNLITLRCTYKTSDVVINNGAKKNNRKTITRAKRYKVMKRDCFRCVLCGRDSSESRLEIDHIIPVSKGGGDNISNLQTLCFDCNRGKSDS